MARQSLLAAARGTTAHTRGWRVRMAGAEAVLLLVLVAYGARPVLGVRACGGVFMAGNVCAQQACGRHARRDSTVCSSMAVAEAPHLAEGAQ